MSVKTENFIPTGTQGENAGDFFKSFERLVQTRKYGLINVDLAVRAVNSFAAELGFSIDVSFGKPDNEAVQATFTTSRPIHQHFFHSLGVFWGAVMTLDSYLHDGVTPTIEQAELIFSAETKGIDTYNIALDRKNLGANGWKVTLAEIQRQLT